MRQFRSHTYHTMLSAVRLRLSFLALALLLFGRSSAYAIWNETVGNSDSPRSIGGNATDVKPISSQVPDRNKVQFPNPPPAVVHPRPNMHSDTTRSRVDGFGSRSLRRFSLVPLRGFFAFRSPHNLVHPDELLNATAALNCSEDSANCPVRYPPRQISKRMALTPGVQRARRPYDVPQIAAKVSSDKQEVCLAFFYQMAVWQLKKDGPFVPPQTLNEILEIMNQIKLPHDDEVPFDPNEKEGGTNFDCVTPFEMSYKYYNRLWAEAQAQLEYILQKEWPLNEEEPEIISERLVLVRRVSKMYLQYIGITNKIIKCHAHIAQPQKRILLRKTADACIGRVLELKHELVALENSEFHFLDDMLLSLRMVPKDMDVEIPEYFTEKTDEEMERKKFVEFYLNIESEKEKKKYIVTERMKLVKTAMVFLRLIQTHERTRQAREVFSEHQKRFIVKELNKQREASKGKETNINRQNAATTIQRAWRKHKVLKSLRREFEAEMRFLGMLPQPRKQLNTEAGRDRLHIIKRNEEEYLKTEATLKTEMIVYKVPEMMENLENKIRSYLQDYFVLYGKYPEFPTAEDGGSKKMFETRVDFDTESINTAGVSEMKPETKKDIKSQKGKKDTKPDKDTKKGKDSKSDEPKGYSVRKSNYVSDLISLQEEYNAKWLGKEPTNFDKFDLDILKENVVKIIEKQVQFTVDEKMRLELKKLTEALQKDTKKKANPKKKGKDKEGKGKGKKESKEEDLTPGRTLESLVEELVSEGIIVSYPKYKLCNFIGDYNYTGSAQHILAEEVKNDPYPCLLDIRRVINEYCILPMGSQEIHFKGPFVKSLLIAGPKGVGKKSLIYAVCNEIDATLMNLSAENIEGKYPGEEGKKMLLHLILKVGRLLQPTIIFVEDAENYFYKKIPSSCTLSEPGRLKKDLPKFLKSIHCEDRIMICGTAVLPFDVDLKGLADSYNKIICIFKPDYNCRRSLWREFIARNKGILTRKLDMTVLCNVSDGFSAGAIETSVKQTLTTRRLAFQKKIPICATDFVPELANHVPIYEEENNAYKQWLEKMPIKKKRQVLLTSENEGKEVMDESEEED